MNQFVFGMIIGALLVSVIVGVFFVGYRLGQRSERYEILPSPETNPQEERKDAIKEENTS